MLCEDVNLRPAKKSDSHDIAALFLISSDGLAEYIWQDFAIDDEPLIDVGTRRYARDDVAFSWQNCFIAEKDGKVIGMLHGFPMEVDPNEAPTTDPVLAPYSRLEEDQSYYISGLALRPDNRGRGIGKALMAMAEDKTQRLSLNKISLICFEQNKGAMKLYRTLGFKETAREPLYPHPLLKYKDGDAILMVKTLT